MDGCHKSTDPTFISKSIKPNVYMGNPKLLFWCNAPEPAGVGVLGD